MAVVMLVAADQSMTDAVRVALGEGHAVVAVDDLPAEFGEGAPDVVIVDLAALPDGLDVVRRLKSTHHTPASAVRVGVLGATGTDEERLESAIEGAVLYDTRPLDPQRFRRQLERLLTGEPEEVQRKQVQDAALRALVRLERANRRDSAQASGRFSPPPEQVELPMRARLVELNERQRSVLEAIAVSATREEARLRLGVSRSLLGATLRSAAHRLQFPSVTELVERVRRELGGTEDAADGTEASVLFQPVVDIATGRPTVLEALPFEALDAPAPVPVAGGGRWLLRRACEAACAWRRAESGSGVGVAVDVPARLLGTPHAADDMLVVVTAAGLPPEALTIEVADTVDAAADPEARQALARLRDAGVQLCVDHFGTESSSLASILRLDVDIVKLDAALVTGTGTEDADVMTAVVALASSLAPTVHAEGVDTMAQLTVLDTAGCKAVQGSLVGEPGPPPAAGERIDKSG